MFVISIIRLIVIANIIPFNSILVGESKFLQANYIRNEYDNFKEHAMPIIAIPNVIKKMDSRLLSYILNCSKADIEKLLQDGAEIDIKRVLVLRELIGYCLAIGKSNIIEGYSGVDLYDELQRIFVNGRHVFNHWRGLLGGKIDYIHDDDPIINKINKAYAELYPLFLLFSLNKENRQRSGLSIPHWYFPENDLVCNLLLEDPSLKKMFDIVKDEGGDASGYYMASSGQGGGIQLKVFPANLLCKTYELMRLRGGDSPYAFASAANTILNILRTCAEGEVVAVPVFLGFENIALNNVKMVETPWGIIRSFHSGMTEFHDQCASSLIVGDGSSCETGFILEAAYPFKVKFRTADEDIHTFPDELVDADRGLEKIQENIRFSMSLALDRIPSVSVVYLGRFLFDPLSCGPNVVWSNDHRRIMPAYSLKDRDAVLLQVWAKIIYAVDDSLIRLAVRRVLAALSERMDSEDGFIDVVISWENLFNNSRENISSNISKSISKLLGNSNKDRRTLRKKVINLYQKRSDVVHGTAKLTSSEARLYSEESLSLTLDAFRILYKNMPELLVDSNRSATLAMMENKNIPRNTKIEL